MSEGTDGTNCYRRLDVSTASCRLWTMQSLLVVLLWTMQYILLLSCCEQCNHSSSSSFYLQDALVSASFPNWSKVRLFSNDATLMRLLSVVCCGQNAPGSTIPATKKLTPRTSHAINVGQLFARVLLSIDVFVWIMHFSSVLATEEQSEVWMPESLDVPHLVRHHRLKIKALPVVRCQGVTLGIVDDDSHENTACHWKKHKTYGRLILEASVRAPPMCVALTLTSENLHQIRAAWPSSGADALNQTLVGPSDHAAPLTVVFPRDWIFHAVPLPHIRIGAKPTWRQ